ncbi:hypothetical protein PoB_000069700 [Plakobranchus ocellatus]|uniref:Uncharacterized protein n=1 Tax=Plakobranchus ocellatus TaxID=259542 RepID=A0AAV3XUJ8_9GAST|nr:hypothetical protein PoB_000069700 [Plakobranchus ocellatus]
MSVRLLKILKELIPFSRPCNNGQIQRGPSTLWRLRLFRSISCRTSPLHFPPRHPPQKLRAVWYGRLFGLFRCDIIVPESLRSHYCETPPIKTSRSYIASVMRDYADEHKLLGQPRRTLNKSYIGKNIFLAKRLLPWNLEPGLIVDEIYKVVEYTPEVFPGIR